MAFMRFLIILLLLINGLVLAAWQGWLGEGQSPAEPQRLTNQLNPERIRLLDGTEPDPAPVVTAPPAPPVEPAVTAPSNDTEPAASPALPAPQDPAATATEAPAPEPDPRPEPAPAPLACIAFEGVGDEQAALLMGDALAQDGLKTRDEPTTEVTSWWVHIPSQGSREGADRKVAELRGQGVKDLFAIGERGARPFTVSLGLFKSAESAAEQRRRLEKKGVTGIAIEERGNTTHRIEVSGPDELLAGWASEWTGRLEGATKAECRP